MVEAGRVKPSFRGKGGEHRLLSEVGRTYRITASGVTGVYRRRQEGAEPHMGSESDGQGSTQSLHHRRHVPIGTFRSRFVY